MEIEQYEEAPSHNEMVNGEESHTQKKKSDNSSRSFECNICLDYARDPVVTLCGHLYCWPCIFKWLHYETSTSTSTLESPHQQCPVCKADISEAALVPLYGRGDFSPKHNKDSVEIPRRPLNQQLQGRGDNLESQFRSDQRRQLYAPATSSSSSPVFNLGGPTTHPMVWMFGEMVFARVFGNSAEVNLIGYPNSYQQLTGISPRVRRQEMKAEKSLNRISIFLFCCLVLCLISF